MDIEEKFTSEMDTEGDIDLEKTRRRSSILKPPKQRNPFSSIDVTEYVADSTITRARRVSFASSNYVKPFSADPEKNTIWDNTYEEEINHTDSKNSDLIEPISKTEINVETSKTSSTFYEKTMDFTKLENHTVMTNQLFNNVTDISSGSVMSFAKKKKAEFGLRILPPESCSVENEKENNIIANKENMCLVSPSHAKTIYFDDCTMEVTSVHAQHYSVKNSEILSGKNSHTVTNKTICFKEFSTKLGDMEMTLNTGLIEQGMKSDLFSAEFEKTIQGHSRTVSGDEPISMELTTVMPPNIFKESNNEADTSSNLESNNIPRLKTVFIDEPSSMEITTVRPLNVLQVHKNKIEMTCDLESNNTQSNSLHFDEPSSMEFTTVVPSNVFKIHKNKSDMSINLESNNIPLSKFIRVDEPSSMDFTTVVPPNILKLSKSELEMSRNLAPNNMIQSTICVSEPNSKEFTTVIPPNILNVHKNDLEMSSNLLSIDMPQNSPLQVKDSYNNVDNEQWCENMEMTCNLEKSVFHKSVYEPSGITSFEKNSETKENVKNVKDCVAEKSPCHMLSLNKPNIQDPYASPELCRDSTSKTNVGRSPTFIPLDINQQYQNTHEVKCTHKGKFKMVKPIKQTKNDTYKEISLSHTPKMKRCRAKTSKEINNLYAQNQIRDISQFPEAQEINDTRDKLIENKKNNVSQEPMEISTTQPQQDNIDETKAIPETSCYKNLNYTQSTENYDNLSSANNKVICTVKSSKLKTPKSSFNIELSSSICVEAKENLSEFGPEGSTKTGVCKTGPCTSSPIFDDKNISESMFLDAVLPAFDELDTSNPVGTTEPTATVHNMLRLEDVKKNLKHYDFPEDKKELAENREALERFHALQKRLKSLIKNFEFPKIDIIDLRELHKTLSLSETSNNESSKPEQAEQQRLSLHDTIVEESSRSKFWQLKSSENEDCDYYLNTHFKMVTLKVIVEKEKGKVYSIEIIKNKKNCTDWISQFTLNKIFLPKLEDGHLLSALGPNYDILTLLDYLNVSMEPIYKFVMNFIELQELHREFNLKMNPDYSLTSEILDVSIGLWWVITIKMSTLEILDDVSGQSETSTAEISEQQIKSLAKNTPKGLDCIGNFLSDVYAYYQRTKSKMLNR